MIILSINLRKIDQSKCQNHANGAKYCELVLIERDGTDKYGNDYMVVQGVTKEERLAGVKGEILGNGKNTGTAPKPREDARQTPSGPSSGSTSGKHPLTRIWTFRTMIPKSPSDPLKRKAPPGIHSGRG